MDARPVGVFDSGLGGLTVVRALAARLPGEAIVYLGDTARVPYGTKSAETVVRYSLRCADFLRQRGVKALLVACNTASAHALPALAAALDLPVLGAVEPGADEAVRATRGGVVGIIGTLGTVRSGAYERALMARAPHLKLAALACPLLVPLVEEGWLGAATSPEGAQEREVARRIVARYLGELRRRAPALDVLVLGCTHYPLLSPLVAEVAAELWSHPVELVDSARAMAGAAAHLLAERALLGPGPGGLSCWVTDEARFDEVATRFLGAAVASTKVDL